MRIIRIIFYIILIILAISFAALNASSVQINLYLTTIKLPISVLMVLMIAVGLLLGFILSLPKYWKCKLDGLKTRNQLKITEKEIKNLRDIPLKNQH